METKMHPRLPAFLLVLAIAALPANAIAGPATDVVKGLDEPLGEKLDAGWDFDLMARDSLGSEWAHRSAAEKKEFTGLLRHIVDKANQKLGTDLAGHKIEYLGEVPVGQDIKVRTRALSPRGREDDVEIDYRLNSITGSWRVIDRTMDGVSMTAAYRSQFTKIVKREGFAALLEKMRKKIAAVEPR